MNEQAIAGLILCGGASRRMGSPKALLTILGETFADRLIGVLGEVCAPVVVVVGYERQRVREGLRRDREARVVENPAPERGMLSSLQCGLRAVPDEAEAVIFTPVDYPAIRVSTVRALAEAFRRERAPVTQPVYKGEHGHPVCVSRAVSSELLALGEERQARDVIRAHRAGTCFVMVEDAAILADVDYPNEYQALLAAEGA